MATAVSIGAGLVAAKTGISAKVDRAASKVFGKDVVKFANIAGAVYGAAGGFAGAGPSEVFSNISGAFGGAASGASSAAGGLGSAVDATGGIETAVEAAGNMGGAPSFTPGAMGGDYGGAPNGPGGSGAFRPGASGSGPANQPQGALSKLWGGLGASGQNSLIQVGGQVLSGIGQGKMQEEQMRREDERDKRYRSGSTVGWGRQVPGALTAFNDFYARGAKVGP